MAKVFSGAQPTGTFTIGNYLGAISNWVKMQKDNDCMFCIVDLHAITLPQDPHNLHNISLNNLALYIASGLDPKKSTLFIQSSVPEHSELMWIFSCITPLGWLNRMTQFKDKAGKNRENASLGLYAYPVLMAADILLYDATHVPVGEDQTQHLELARDIGGAFNRNFNVNFFREPIAINVKNAERIKSLRDGTKKMSKSDESDYSRINMTDDADLIMLKLRKAKTDSIEGIYFDEEKRPEVSNLLTIYAAFAGVSIDETVKNFSNFSTLNFKEAVAEQIISSLNHIQTEYNHLVKDKAELIKIARQGTDQARAIASKRIADIKKAVGLFA